MSDWQQKLSQVLADTLNASRPALTGDTLVMLAVDCHPWDGGLYVAVLTQSEVETDSSLADPAEMAAWKHYDFAESLSEFNVDSLCETMKSDYYATENCDQTARGYLRACAAALADNRVRSALQAYVLRDAFRVSVTHPDDRTEYCATQTTRLRSDGR
ncbi:MAG: hypothetical protein AAFU85_29085 [Planctomycetota bacterium]